MDNIEESWDAAEFIRSLARRGMVKQFVAAASARRRRWLRAGACEIVVPLVFAKLTRRFEQGRGHYVCATAFQRLRPECVDRFHDDVDSIVENLFTRADFPIVNLDGWIVACMPRATIDGNRTRRGERGAQQRPRLTVWLKQELDDPWLMELALAILDWVGVESTAGSGLWPLTAWAGRRAVHFGTERSDEAAVQADIDVVLAVMRRRRDWFQRNIEVPLGYKQTPVWLARPVDGGAEPEPDPLLLVSPGETLDALMYRLAAEALDTIRLRVRCGESPETVVPEVVEAVFGSYEVSRGFDCAPGTEPLDVELAVEHLRDPARRKAVLDAVLAVLREEAAGKR